MTSPRVTTDRDLRDQVVAYLHSGDSPSDYDVDAIVADILQRHGLVSIEDIAPEQWLDILMMNDTSADDVRQDLAPVLTRVNRFFSSAHAELPVPEALSCHVRIPTRALLDGLAGDFGLPVPQRSAHYAGAQFSVEIAGLGPRITVIFFFEEPR